MARGRRNDYGFLLLLRQIAGDRGIDCSGYKSSYLKRRIAVRLRANQIKSYREYRQFLERNPEEYTKLMDALTINVTGFFRDVDVFDLFRELVLPDVIKNKEECNQRIIRIWSAGCATGEEPYSIAMILRDVLGKDLSGFIVSIYATDVDKRSLNLARRGEYEQAQVRDVPGEYLGKYFIQNGKHKVVAEVKSLVKFKQAGLFADLVIKESDVIFCRNVLIYFSSVEQQELLEKFYGALCRRGYLIIGKTETLSGRSRDRFTCLDPRRRIYKKVTSLET